MRVAVDTNRYVDLCKGVDETIEILEQAEEILMPFVVLGELRAGFAHGRREAENERVLRRFLLKDGVRVMFADDQTTEPRLAFKPHRRAPIPDSPRTKGIRAGHDQSSTGRRTAHRVRGGRRRPPQS